MDVVVALAGGGLGAVAGRAGRRLLASRLVGLPVPGYRCEAGVGLLWAVLAARIASGAVPLNWAPVPLLLGWAGVLLAVADLRAHRLPDALTLPALPLACALVALAGGAGALRAALLGAVLHAGAYALVRLLAPAALGPGDVKLAAPLGTVVGAVSPSAVLGCLVSAAVLSALHACCARSRAVPHGPAMLLPAWLVAALGSPPAGG
ncbi:prepilin peptidase [Saccharopolyspora sp. MS10]|uniref:prepilin peptidase n=1 Tax=Saccharopolyspora sp. MS10 TaxID=3385973 RepID=UPI0039A3F74A